MSDIFITLSSTIMNKSKKTKPKIIEESDEEEESSDVPITAPKKSKPNQIQAKKVKKARTLQVSQEDTPIVATKKKAKAIRKVSQDEQSKNKKKHLKKESVEESSEQSEEQLPQKKTSKIQAKPKPSATKRTISAQTKFHTKKVQSSQEQEESEESEENEQKVKKSKKSIQIQSKITKKGKKRLVQASSSEQHLQAKNKSKSIKTKKIVEQQFSQEEEEESEEEPPKKMVVKTKLLSQHPVASKKKVVVPEPEEEQEEEEQEESEQIQPAINHKVNKTVLKDSESKKDIIAKRKNKNQIQAEEDEQAPPPRKKSKDSQKGRNKKILLQNQEKEKDEEDQEGEFQICVKGLSFDAYQDQVRALFEECGQILNLKLLTRPEGKPKGISFIKFGRKSEFNQALNLNGSQHMGRIITVQKAQGRQNNNQSNNNQGQFKQNKNFNEKVVSIQTPCLFVGGLSYDSTVESITNYFSNAGNVQSVRIVTDRQTGKPRGFGYVEFYDVDSAKRAYSNLNNGCLDNKKIRIDSANPRQKSDGNRGNFGGKNNNFSGGNKGFGGSRQGNRNQGNSFVKLSENDKIAKKGGMGTYLGKKTAL